MVTFIELKKQIPEEGVPIDVIINNQSISAVNNRFPDVVYRNGKFYTIHLEIEVEGVTHWMYSPTIKSVTNCITCGSECDVNTDGTTHYYISKTEHFKTELAEKDKVIDIFAIGFAKWIRENGYGYSKKFNLYQKSLINETIFFYEKELIELYKQSLNK